MLWIAFGNEWCQYFFPKCVLQILANCVWMSLLPISAAPQACERRGISPVCRILNCSSSSVKCSPKSDRPWSVNIVCIAGNIPRNVRSASATCELFNVFIGMAAKYDETFSAKVRMYLWPAFDRGIYKMSRLQIFPGTTTSWFCLKVPLTLKILRSVFKRQKIHDCDRFFTSESAFSQ